MYKNANGIIVICDTALMWIFMIYELLLFVYFT